MREFIHIYSIFFYFNYATLTTSYWSLVNSHRSGLVPAGTTNQKKCYYSRRMPKSSRNLVWMDLEMSGLYPEKDVILEIATIVTDANLNILAEGPVIAIHQPENVFESMDEWNTRHHNQSGLVDRSRRSQYSLKDSIRLPKKARTSSAEIPSHRTGAFCTSTCTKFRNGSATAIST